VLRLGPGPHSPVSRSYWHKCTAVAMAPRLMVVASADARHSRASQCFGWSRRPSSTIRRLGHPGARRKVLGGCDAPAGRALASRPSSAAARGSVLPGPLRHGAGRAFGLSPAWPLEAEARRRGRGRTSALRDAIRGPGPSRVQRVDACLPGRLGVPPGVRTVFHRRVPDRGRTGSRILPPHEFARLACPSSCPGSKWGRPAPCSTPAAGGDPAGDHD